MADLYSNTALGKLIQQVTEAKFDDVPEQLQRLITYLMQMMQADRMTLGRLLDDEKIEFLSVSRKGVRPILDSQDFVATHRPIDKEVIGLIKEGKVRVFDSSLTETFGKPERLKQYDLDQSKGFVLIPIFLRDEPWGQLTCVRLEHHHQWDDQLIAMLQQASITIASAYERYLFYRQAVEQKQRAEALSHALLANQESERKFIAQELHDNFSQQMALITLETHVLMDQLNLPADKKQMATSLSERIESLAGNLQQLSRSLHPKILHDLGFYSAIAAESRRIESLKPITIHLIVDSQLADKLTDSIQLHLYRITQEALGNIVKHATSAETVLISLNDDGEDIVYSIRDDGRGSDSTQKAGLGLTSIEERALQCGGVAKFLTAPCEGFEVEIRLPYSAFTRKQP